MSFVQRTPQTGSARSSPYPTALSRSSSTLFDPAGNGGSPDPGESPSPFHFPPGSQREMATFGLPFPASNRPDPSTALVTHYSAFLGLDENRSEAAHEFNTNIQDPATKMALTYVHILSLSQRTSAIEDTLKKLNQQLTDITMLVKAAWKLTDAQQTALRKLLLNYLLRPMKTYGKRILDLAMEYISKHRSKFHLDAFLTDEIIKATIFEFLKSRMNEIRSHYRKRLWKRVHFGLITLADTMILEFHTSPTSIDPTEKERIRAVLALQRKVAIPLVGRAKVKGADTGFWGNLEKELRALTVKHGSDRSSAGWKAWESEIIAADKALHTSSETEDTLIEEF
ncbi:hypothetical protein C8R43DRAFT_1132054 [Mycena crocata]|nr:hypothetical protein C8R43DRAFT_1132054 [Mycena crocata]